MKERLEEKLSNQIFYHDMEKVFEPSIQQQKEITKSITTKKKICEKLFFKE